MGRVPRADYSNGQFSLATQMASLMFFLAPFSESPGPSLEGRAGEDAYIKSNGRKHCCAKSELADTQWPAATETISAE